MKQLRFVLFFLSSLIVLSTVAKKRIFLFDEFVPGRVLMRNGAHIDIPLNYDASNNHMLYLQDGKQIILLNTQEIDTIYIDNRKFIPINRAFLEICKLPNGLLSINWQLREVFKGYRGAYGQIIQSHVESVNTNAFQPGTSYELQRADVTVCKNKNQYWVMIGGRPHKFTNKKTLFRLFLAHKKELESYWNLHNCSFDKPALIMIFIDYCLGLQ